MDYLDAFKQLNTNNKYCRKSPHKAILLLTVIEMYETNALSENMIPYDDALKNRFQTVWNKVLKGETNFQPCAYLPYWYMQTEDFWHIVPHKGQENILTLIKDNNIKPSETKLKDCVKYAELDNDLYFLMTLKSGRSALKKILLETYINLTEDEIARLSESIDNTTDFSSVALSDYEHMLLQDKTENIVEYKDTDNELVRQFQDLNEDIQFVLYIQYFSFLKTHRRERGLFREVYPSVFELLDKVTNNPIKQDEISPSLCIILDTFLSDLKISLMSEEGSTTLIDKINEAIDFLRGNDLKEDKTPINENKYKDSQNNTEEEVDAVIKEKAKDETIPEKDLVLEDRKGKPWTENEEELITLYFNQGKDVASIAAILGRTEVSIKMRLAKLGLIEYVYGQDDPLPVTFSDEIEEKTKQDDFTIQNYSATCSIYNKSGENIFSAEGKLKYIHDKLYRLNLKDKCFTIKEMQYENDKWWIKGAKKIVAYSQSELFQIIENANDYCSIIEDIADSPVFSECKLKVEGKWYDYCGKCIENETRLPNNVNNDILTRLYSEFVPKGKLMDIPTVANSSYDFLWIMSLVEFMQFTPQPSIITYDKMACMTIAIAWEILSQETSACDKEEHIVKCVNYLIEESETEMEISLNWNSSRREVFQAIKDYPMAGVFEDLVDELIEETPYNVLRAWFPDESDNEVIQHSATFDKSCAYAIHPDKRDPYIKMNSKWKNYFFREHDKLMYYYKQYYLEYLEER